MITPLSRINDKMLLNASVRLGIGGQLRLCLMHVVANSPQVVLGAGSVALAGYAAKQLLEPYRYRILHAVSRFIAPHEDIDAEAETAAIKDKVTAASVAQEKEDAATEALRQSVGTLQEQNAQLCAAIESLAGKVDTLATRPRRSEEVKSEVKSAVKELQGTMQAIVNTLHGPQQDRSKEELQMALKELQASVQHLAATCAPWLPQLSAHLRIACVSCSDARIKHTLDPILHRHANPVIDKNKEDIHAAVTDLKATMHTLAASMQQPSHISDGKEELQAAVRELHGTMQALALSLQKPQSDDGKAEIQNALKELQHSIQSLASE